ncbi:hypothetical protein DL769_002899 [Monosporascus sp. CRB-8-3]|nr:hypothetical protein DL769_002899 [Monosporascus sp. CRB-8-3]
MSAVTLHLHAEAAPIGTRGIISPTTAHRLIQDGYNVYVERSNVRYFKDSGHAAVGCTLVPADSWPDAPLDHIIIGMKALPEGDFPLKHVHAHAAHCYRNQAGWDRVLMRFHQGGGLLLDLEFITDENGERFITFGRETRPVGAALASRETEVRTDYSEILEHDVLTNRVSLSSPVAPFVTFESLKAPGRKLTVISGISNGSHSPDNQLPIYTNSTNSDVRPTVRIPTPSGTVTLTIAMIPYLPSLLPREASESAANGLYPAISLLGGWQNHGVWLEVEKMYRDKIAALTGNQTTKA